MWRVDVRRSRRAMTTVVVVMEQEYESSCSIALLYWFVLLTDFVWYGVA